MDEILHNLAVIEARSSGKITRKDIEAMRKTIEVLNSRKSGVFTGMELPGFFAIVRKS